MGTDYEGDPGMRRIEGMASPDTSHPRLSPAFAIGPISESPEGYS